MIFCFPSIGPHAGMPFEQTALGDRLDYVHRLAAVNPFVIHEIRADETGQVGLVAGGAGGVEGRLASCDDLGSRLILQRAASSITPDFCRARAVFSAISLCSSTAGEAADAVGLVVGPVDGREDHCRVERHQPPAGQPFVVFVNAVVAVWAQRSSTGSVRYFPGATAVIVALRFGRRVG